jgi:hypothetical protein
MNTKPAYTVEELLSFHPGGRTALFGEIKAGKLMARKLGARTIILHSDYLAYLDSLPVIDRKPMLDEVSA